MLVLDSMNRFYCPFGEIETGFHPILTTIHVQKIRTDSGDEGILHNESTVTMNQLSGNERAFVGGQK